MQILWIEYESSSQTELRYYCLFLYLGIEHDKENADGDARAPYFNIFRSLHSKSIVSSFRVCAGQTVDVVDRGKDSIAIGGAPFIVTDQCIAL